jgi:hypothetical protein
MNRDILLRLHNIVSKSALQFGSETWILRKEDKRRLEASHEISQTHNRSYLKR